ncbi:MAG: XkdX family protein [Anaerotignaceae bacterium]
MFKVVKRYYVLKIYSNDNVKIFVIAKRLTAEQYKLITGEVYTA